VVIATPVGTHFPLAEQALQAGKHVFIEKPMACSVSQCKTLIETAKDKGLILMAGHTFLYAAAVRKIKAIIDSGEIGDVKHIVSRRLNLGLYQSDVNVAWDLAPHDISIILYLMGEAPVAVNCTGEAHLGQGLEDITTMSLTFDNQRRAVIHSSWLHPDKVRETVIIGSKGMIVYDDTEQEDKIRICNTRVEVSTRDGGTTGFYEYPSRVSRSLRIEQEEPLKLECQDFLNCVKTGETPFSDADKGLDVVRILEASSQSLRNDGEKVMIDGSTNDLGLGIRAFSVERPVPV
jgi:predicted dehydrogenase